MNNYRLDVSRQFLVVHTLLYLLAIVAILISDLMLLIKLVLLLCAIIYYWHTLRRDVLLKGKKSIQRIQRNAEGDWSLYNRAGQSWEATLKGDSLRSPWLVILNFKVSGFWFNRSVILFPDSLSEDSFRRLRVQLLQRF